MPKVENIFLRLAAATGAVCLAACGGPKGADTSNPILRKGDIVTVKDTPLRVEEDLNNSDRGDYCIVSPGNELKLTENPEFIPFWQTETQGVAVRTLQDSDGNRGCDKGDEGYILDVDEVEPAE